MSGVQELIPLIGVFSACAMLGVARASYYRNTRPRPAREPVARPPSFRALSVPERAAVRDCLHQPEHANLPPLQVYARLLDQGVHLCSVSTMYRILRGEGEVRERRNQLVHPAYAKPELLATAPNQLWSWDITKLKGPAKWTYYFLYVVLDVFSRYVVGWLLAERESQMLACKLIEESCEKHHITPGQLTLHADRGAVMRSKTLAQKLADLEVYRTHSRPHCSNDNPFSEAQFKTLKYAPDFPGRFESREHGIRHCQAFFDWYNHHHRHSGIALMTPVDRHYGRTGQVLHVRQAALDSAYANHPQRFVRKPPRALAPPAEVWINKPNPNSPLIS